MNVTDAEKRKKQTGSDEKEDKLHACDFTIAQLQKIWNERSDKIVDGGR